MATLPTTENLYQVEFVSQPSLTWAIDKKANQIIGETDGPQAVKQAVEIILNVERFRWQIYEPYSGIQTEGLLGQNPGYVGTEFRRRVEDALLVDDRITGISEYKYTVNGNSILVSFMVNTIYGRLQAQAEVVLT